ncbi:ABC transporter permease [Diaminobutyricimonas sp. TR449]|uniref:ABC transporter permease n=1 Tax=Diaminobutyricimonas sp. TR449 TaxID=2708076 RepID=UPI00141F5046|nr:ABC transporter permease [Diaminobutyricimonas sp. TR449]
MSKVSTSGVRAVSAGSTSGSGSTNGRNNVKRPSALTLGARRIGYEVKAYFRQKDGLVFTFGFPIIMLLIFSVAFSEGGFGQDADGNDVSAAAYYLPAMLAAGLLLSGVQNLAVDIATEKSDGTLKRLAGSPLPMMSYFVGKIGQVFVTGVLQAVLIIAVAALAFGVALPNEPAKWATFAWVFVLGIVTSAVLGIALSGLPRSGKSATAVVIPIVLLLQFISGVYLPFSQLPDWLQNVASAFPLKWMAQGMRNVFLPENFEALEMGGAWDLPGIGLWLGVWLVAGLVLCRLTFRWIRKDS